MKEKPLVSISCLTYNHEKYIKQCLDGLLMQETTFSFEVLVHDDASKDGTAKIIHEYELKYPEIIKPIYQTENQYSKGGGIIAKIQRARTSGKYVAYCEGDDWWTDKKKLQKQIDFLEKNTEYGMCYGMARKFCQSKERVSGIFGADFHNFDHLLKGNVIPTLTVCARVSLVDKYMDEINPYNRGWVMGDYPRWLWFAENSKIKFMNEIFATYRVLDESASHSNSLDRVLRFNKSYVEIQNFYSMKYRNRPVAEFDKHFFSAFFYMKIGDRESALRELSLIKNKNLKIKILLFISRNSFLFSIYRKLKVEKQ